MAYKLMTKLQHAALAVAPRLFGFQWIMVAQAPRGAGAAAEATPAPAKNEYPAPVGAG